jgi:IS30 family transposase
VKTPAYSSNPLRLRPTPNCYFVPEENTIQRHPLDINRRINIGHWECDLVGFRQEFGKHKLRTLVERFSRYLILTSNASRHTAGIMAGIEKGLAPLPSPCRQSITFDRGSEFTG